MTGLLSQLRSKGITKAELDALILNDQDIADKAYNYNGVSNPASPNFKSLAQSRLRLRDADLDALILNEQDIAKKAYDYNGVSNPHAPNFQSLMQNYK